ncbi:MAG: endonuclease MutS2 [Desulfotomaculales bacterium]
MRAETLKRLEYDKILSRLAAFCVSAAGRELALALRPIDDREAIRRAQAETTEGTELLRLEPLADLGGWPDVRREVARAQQGGVLEPGELFAVGQALKACRQYKKFFAERAERYPLMGGIAAGIGSFAALEKEIFAAILPGPEVADHASPALAGIRRRLAALQQEVRDRLDSLVRSPAVQKYLQEPLVTQREGRYVIPVKQEFRAQVPGIVHDQSASGATVFIEPLAVVEVNNEIRRLRAAERQEIERILARLSALVAAAAEEVSVSLERLARLDFILARARYSRELDAREPEFDFRRTFFDLKGARHPLLGGGAVPVDIRIGEDFDTLVITGPNTGGKTVALKTAGLLVLMAQSGLHVPVEEGTRLGFFRRVFADIGDEQSIEQSLSTFSGHMKNIVAILREAGPDSLVLLDELGAGTDPVEGAALAQAILERLQEKGAKTVATTHYSELKNFAHARERVENACVEFDVVTLMPTYRLITGRPGGSRAFAIARRLGVDAALVERARSFMSAEQVALTDLLAGLEEKRQLAAREREEARRAKEEALALKERYAELERSLSERRQEILGGAAREARQIVRRAREEAEEIVREMRARASEEASADRERAIYELRRRIREAEDRLISPEPGGPDGDRGEVPENVGPGQEVYLPRFRQQGCVVAAAGEGQFVVQVGAVKLTLPKEEMRLAEKSGDSGQGQKPKGAGLLMAEKAKEVSLSVSVRGMRVAEALEVVEKYLDDAVLAGLPRVYVIHGKGTGTLRSVIQEQLKKDRRVKSFRLGEHGEGGAGVTVVELV